MSLDTTHANRRMTHFDGHDSIWLFGYGSLIWKADFPYHERRPAYIYGWDRRFWQGSHDHRGTPEAPGRVVTLIRRPDAICYGMAYRIGPEVLGSLDVREKNGYLREIVTLHFLPTASETSSRTASPTRSQAETHHTSTAERDEGLVYLAGQDNAAFLGDAPHGVIAEQIARAHGPSGPNRDYLLNLAASLEAMGVEDPHIRELVHHLPATPPLETPR
ncbi:gamma-glutamylcyclotransferase [Halomonas sp. TRM85114]|uniref:gamma-glutamylcyclotransferase n=1 Tax=Halomonas jincaotanensis TaxID=2810616 RepID=UPI001BD5D58A|nr:gamma-glutamylcyclotransferase [Halomonas jincaotanensis]MBS9405550.1 gamma-glutamylcyclotransferase [Halomonas jincaotanensis]